MILLFENGDCQADNQLMFSDPPPSLHSGGPKHRATLHGWEFLISTFSNLKVFLFNILEFTFWTALSA